MKLVLLTAALFGVAFGSPVSQNAIEPDITGEESPADVGPADIDDFSPIAPAADDVIQTRTISNSVQVNGDFTQYIVHSNPVDNRNKIYISEQYSVDGIALPFSNVYRDVTQTSTLSNSGPVSRDHIQYIIHINGISGNRRELNAVDKFSVNGSVPIPDDPSILDKTNKPISNVFGRVTQTSTLTNSGAVSRERIRYIIHINGFSRNAKAIKISDKDSASISDGHAFVDDYKPSQVDPVDIDNSSLFSRRQFRDITQTSTVSNSGPITRDLIQYIIQINGLTSNEIRNVINRIPRNGIRSFAESSIVDEYKSIQVDPISIDESSISVDSAIHDDNTPIIEETNGPTSNVLRDVFRDITQTSTLSNSGPVTRDLIQNIVHINGLTANEILRLAFFN